MITPRCGLFMYSSMIIYIYMMSLYDDIYNDFYVDEISWDHDDGYVVQRALMDSLC